MSTFTCEQSITDQQPLRSALANQNLTFHGDIITLLKISLNKRTKRNIKGREVIFGGGNGRITES